MTAHHPIRKTVTPEPTVSRTSSTSASATSPGCCEVPAYVLRFWETEFPAAQTQQRRHRPAPLPQTDVEMALRIKSLLYDQGYTIPGARQVFSDRIESQRVSRTPQLAAAPTAAPASAPPSST